MSTFTHVLNDFTILYNQGDYSQALQLVSAELPDHPDYAAVLRCFQIAMMSRTGDIEGALNGLQVALQDGFWYHEDALQGDPDFAPLQGIPEFESLVEQNASARRQAVIRDVPQIAFFEPKTREPWPLLIALHGNLSNIDLFAPYWESAAELGWLVAVPQSSRMSWLSGFYDWSDLDSALDEVESLYRTLLANFVIDENRIVVAGFSMGALVAEQLAISRRVIVDGLCWVDGPNDEEVGQILSATPPKGLRAYLVAGQSQDFVQTAETLVGQFIAHGIECAGEGTASAHHEIPVEFQQILERALNFLCPSL